MNVFEADLFEKLFSNNALKDNSFDNLSHTKKKPFDHCGDFIPFPPNYTTVHWQNCHQTHAPKTTQTSQVDQHSKGMSVNLQKAAAAEQETCQLLSLIYSTPALGVKRFFPRVIWVRWLQINNCPCFEQSFISMYSSKHGISNRLLLMWHNALMSPTQTKEEVKMFSMEWEDGRVEGK